MSLGLSPLLAGIFRTTEIPLVSVPLLCLVDSDPHGLEIFFTYKFGSASLAFDATNLTVDRLSWIGIKGSEWDSLGVGRDELLPLTNADRKKAWKMLSRDWLPEEARYVWLLYANQRCLLC